MEQPGFDEPCYVISVVAKMVGLPPQTLRYYERTGLLEPSRSSGNIRLYSPREVVRIRRIKTLMSDMGVNLAGVEVALRLMAQLQEMEDLVRHLNAELQRRQSPAGSSPSEMGAEAVVLQTQEGPDGGAEEVVS